MMKEKSIILFRDLKRDGEFTIDIARTKAGEWKVIELNDGKQTGFSYTNSNELYSNLAQVFK